MSQPKQRTIYIMKHSESVYDSKILSPYTWLSSQFWFNSFDLNIIDPSLSKKGKQQNEIWNAILKSDEFLSKNNIDLILTSPLSRAIDTTLQIFNNNHNDIQISPYIREYLQTKSDIGLVKNELKKKYKNTGIDLYEINNDIWWYNNCVYGEYKDITYNDCINGYVIKEDEYDLKKRIKDFVCWLYKNDDENIFIVGHNNWIKMFTKMGYNIEYGDIVKVEMNGINIGKCEYVYMDYHKV